MATSQHDIAATIEAFIRRQFRVVEGDPHFSRDVHLFESGYVDSAGAVELIAFVGSAFAVEIEDEDVFSDRFTTIDGIAGIVMSSAARRDERSAAVR